MFSIIVPAYDPFDRFVPSGAIQRALENVLKLRGDFELIVVNNNPIAACPQITQYLRSLASSSSGTIKIVEPNANLGSSGGFNAGMRVAQSDSQYLVFMSADADVVDPLMLKTVQEVFESEPRLGIAHPMSVYEDSDHFNFSSRYGSEVVYRMIRQQCPPESAEIPADELQRILETVSSHQGIKAPLPGTPLTFAVYRQKMIEQIGPFDEGFLICYETDDLGYRALLAGYGIARLNGVFVNHRRLLFHNLCASETKSMPHSEVIRQSAEWWNKKWGRPYIELYARWRWGSFLFTIMLPYFWLRRLGVSLKRTLDRS